MTVLVTLDFPPRHGGIQEYLFERVRHLYGAQDRVVLPFEPGEEVRARLSTRGVRIVARPCTTFGRLPVVYLLSRTLKKVVRPGETVECGNVYAALAARMCGCRYTVYTYGTELLGLDRHSLRASLLRRVLRDADERCVLGEYTLSLLRRCGIGGAVRREPPRLSLRGIEPCPPPAGGMGRILVLGRLVGHKGHDTVLGALALLDETIWSLDIAGAGPCETSLRRRAARLGVARRVRFHGAVDAAQREELFRAATVLVLASRQERGGTEGFGIVLLEAMARGVVAAGSRCGEIPVILDNGSCGLLFEPGNEQELARELSRLEHENTLRAALTDKARARVGEHYAWNE